MSISRCCPGQLFRSNVRPGRHLRRRQMLLHTHTGSQRGFYDIKQTAFLSRCTVTLQRKPHCTGTRCDAAWAVGLLASLPCLCIRECVSGCEYLTPPPSTTTCPSARCLLHWKTKESSVGLDRSVILQF